MAILGQLYPRPLVFLERFRSGAPGRSTWPALDTCAVTTSRGASVPKWPGKAPPAPARCAARLRNRRYRRPA